jgi:hypothetical protein
VKAQGHLLAPDFGMTEGVPFWQTRVPAMLGFSAADLTQKNLANVYVDFAVFCDAWAPLVARWEVENFELLQPRVPDNNLVLATVNPTYIAAVGQLELELQGASVGGNYAMSQQHLLDSIQGKLDGNDT